MTPYPALLLLMLGGVIGSTACNRETPRTDTRAPEPAKIAAPRIAQAPAPAPAPAPSTSSQAPKLGAPDGFVRMTVGGLAPTSRGNAVLLVDEEKKVAVPIFIGEAEALSIQLRLEKRHYDRPLTHDLLDAMMGKLGGRVESVRVDKFQDNVYFGTVIVTTGERRIELDSRSSDAVALAVGNDAPIFVARQVVDRAAVALEDLHAQANSKDDPEVPVEEPKRNDFSL